MKKMKKLTILFISIAVFVLQGCSSGQKAENVATDFLKAYLSTDYTKAAEFCTPELAGDFTEAVRDLEELPSDVKDLMKKHTRNYTPDILSVDAPKGCDTVIVSYSIVNQPQADSISTGGETIIEKQLSLVKVEGSWKVAALNNNK